MERITAIVRGRVQGVGYRYFIAKCAHATGVHGFVQNLPDGTVGMVAESSPAALEDFVLLAHAKKRSCYPGRGNRGEKRTGNGRVPRVPRSVANRG